MRRAAFWVLGVVLLMRATPGAAQPPASLPRVVVDAHGVSAGLPSAEGWTPTVPADAPVPARGLGVQGGGHVQVGGFGVTRLGAGAMLLVAEGRTAPLDGSVPKVTTRVTALAPHVSFNFGHRLGWSYLSLGYGAARVESAAAAAGALPAAYTDSGWSPALNFGGGARWFLRDHFGVGFDLRWHRLSSRNVSDRVTAPSSTLFILGAGLTFQ